VTPVPVRDTVCGESGALSLKVSVADLDPVACGRKTITTVQVAAGDSDWFWQLFDVIV